MNNENKARCSMIPIPIMYSIALVITLWLMDHGFNYGMWTMLVFFLGGAGLSIPFFYLINYYSQENWKDVAKSMSCPKCNQPLVYVIPTWTQNGYNFCNSCKEKIA